MSKFDRVLSDDFFDDLGARTAYDNWVGFGRRVEQAVLAKLAEQEPVAWIFEDDLPSSYPYEEMFKYSKVDVVRVFPVCAPTPTPCVSNENHKTACVSKNGKSEMQHHLEYLKRYQNWRRGEDKTMTEAGLGPKQIGEALDWLILFAENHIADKCKKVPEGWQLVPIEITAGMLRDAHIRSELGAYAVSNLSEGYYLIRNLYDVLMASAPKYTGEK